MSESLLEQLKELEDLFAVDRVRLKQIAAHFVKELEKGELLKSRPEANRH